MSEPVLLPLEDGAAAQADLTGGKASALAQLVCDGAPVPPGFAITTHAYDAFVSADALETTLRGILAARCDGDVSGEQAAEFEIRSAFASRPLPRHIRDAITSAYLRLCRSEGLLNDLPVAVRSSATSEDLADASFAGQQDSHLWVVGVDAVLDRVRECWASLFSARALAYRRHLGIDHLGVRMGVLVQKMVNAQVAGVAMTLDPANGDPSCICVEASWGLGESVVAGAVTPDAFRVDKVMLGIIGRRLGSKESELLVNREARGTYRQMVAPERRLRYCLNDMQVQAIARLAKQLGERVGTAVDLEWAIERTGVDEAGRLSLLQCRPETVWTLRQRAQAPCARGVQGLVQSLLKPMSLTSACAARESH